MEVRRRFVDTRLLALCLGGAMFPIVSMFLAGLYVGLGGFGIATARLVSRGSFPGRGGPPTPLDMPLGPIGFEVGKDELFWRLSNDVLLLKSFTLGIEIEDEQ